MHKTSRFNRSWAALAVVLVAGCLFGQNCSTGLPGTGSFFYADTVTIELVNATGAPVDPGLYVDSVKHVVDPPLAAGESLFFDVECYDGTRILTDATQLTGFGPVASDNVAVVDEGIDFYCGDTVSFIFAEDSAGFFTNVEVTY